MHLWLSCMGHLIVAQILIALSNFVFTRYAATQVIVVYATILIPSAYAFIVGTLLSAQATDLGVFLELHWRYLAFALGFWIACQVVSLFVPFADGLIIEILGYLGVAAIVAEGVRQFRAMIDKLDEEFEAEQASKIAAEATVTATPEERLKAHGILLPEDK